jgi:hypothetical protein
VEIDPGTHMICTRLCPLETGVTRSHGAKEERQVEDVHRFHQSQQGLPQRYAEKVWTIHCDDAWCHAGVGAAAVITSPTGVKHRYAACLSFALESDRCTNNVVEYEAVILGLRKLRALGVTTCIIKTDSKVVAGQVEKEYSAKDPALMQYLTVVRSLERQFKGFTLQHVD